ncbi:MAG: 3-dehydroquinate synthase [Pseudomonadota bacterium]|nr:3-dehydroquinate synthase [Pseudomonadota bacterium]
MRIPVVAAGAAYDVVVAEAFGGLGATLAERREPGRCVVVTNPVVGPLHAAALLAELRGARWLPEVLEVPDGEANKTLASWQALVEGLLVARVDRQTPILALGGGVTGDLVGFAAASVLRGVPLVQVPTTLLAMVDSSVGGKTGVNTPHGKNLVGAFHQPELVWAALDTLRTLPDAELRCGFGEVVKHVVIRGEQALAACEALAPALLARDADALAHVVADSVRTKAEIVAEDPLEAGRRAILNLGHTLGHAIEAVCGYGVIRHGEAVALGLLGVTRYAAGRGWLVEPGFPARLQALCGALGLPTHVPPGVDTAALVAAVGFDKKRTRGMLRLVVPSAPGRIDLRSIAAEEVPALVEALPSLAASDPVAPRASSWSP